MARRRIQALVICATAVASTNGFAPALHGRATATATATTTTTTTQHFFFNSDRQSSTAEAKSPDPASEEEDDDDVVVPENFFASLLKNAMPSSNTQQQQRQPAAAAAPVETEEQKQKRLRLQRLADIEAGELRRAARVSDDKFLYLFLFALQLLPLLGNGNGNGGDRITSLLYFFGVAVTTVYLGGRQEVVDAPELVSRDSALYAPIGASLAIGGLYLLLKVGIDITSLYAIMVTIFGALAISDIGVPILRTTFPSIDFANAEVPVPQGVADKLDLDKPTLPLDGLVTLGLGVICTLVYWAPAAMEQKFLISNAIAWALGMVSLGAISLGSFQTGAILLAGLFCYDIFWVFGTDVMMTVATKVEAPVKFIYPAPPSDIPRDYPFSVLGLGDVVIPGLFVRLMSKVNEVLQPKNLSYFNVATGAYAAGLMACFTANEIFHNGQPALLYLDPALVGSALACAAVNDQVTDLWEFQEEEEEEEKEGEE